MEGKSILFFLIIGLIAGWLASLIAKGKGSGLIMNIIIGIAGAFLGGWLFSWLNIATFGFIGSLIMAVTGAVILIIIARIIAKK